MTAYGFQDLPLFAWSDVETAIGQTGLHSTMYRGEGVAEMAAFYHRPPQGLAVKVWHQPLRPVDNPLDAYLWGLPYMRQAEVSRLTDALAIQNLCAAHGLAPRVYGRGVWRAVPDDPFLRPVTLVEDLGTERDTDDARSQAVYDAVVALGQTLGFTIPFCTPTPSYNTVAGKWVDFGGARFTDQAESILRSRYDDLTSFGPHAYQSPYSGAPSHQIRSTLGRLEWLDIEPGRLGFVPETMLDIGCSGGQFLSYYDKRAHTWGLGLDLPDKALGAAEYAAYTGHWNVDFKGVDLRQGFTHDERFDLVLFLSVEQYIGGLVDWVLPLVGRRLIIEAHPQYGHPAIRAWLGDAFDEVAAFFSKDYGRLVVHAERKRG